MLDNTIPPLELLELRPRVVSLEVNEFGRCLGPAKKPELLEPDEGDVSTFSIDLSNVISIGLELGGVELLNWE